MARWTDLARWRGPTVNQGGAMLEHRGLVVHIAEGTFEGTVAWQKNAAAEVSSHFVVNTDGTVAQMVDTDVTAWTQQSGNGHWLSVEMAGHTPNPLTAAQLEAAAQLLARAHLEYGVPLEVATSPAGRGLGHHSMGTNGHSVPTDTWTGPTWGHTDCPGPAIIRQKPAIVARAQQIVGGDVALTKEDLAAIANVAWHSDIDSSPTNTVSAGTVLLELRAAARDLVGRPPVVVDQAALAQAVAAAVTAATADFEARVVDAVTARMKAAALAEADALGS